MSKKLDRMGVLVLVSHLVITLAILAIYAVFTIMGKNVGTIEMILMVIIGYWFGAIGNNQIRPNGLTQIQKADNVQVIPPNANTEVSNQNEGETRQ